MNTPNNVTPPTEDHAKHGNRIVPIMQSPYSQQYHVPHPHPVFEAANSASNHDSAIRARDLANRAVDDAAERTTPYSPGEGPNRNNRYDPRYGCYIPDVDLTEPAYTPLYIFEEGYNTPTLPSQASASHATNNFTLGSLDYRHYSAPNYHQQDHKRDDRPAYIPTSLEYSPLSLPKASVEYATNSLALGPEYYQSHEASKHYQEDHEQSGEPFYSPTSPHYSLNPAIKISARYATITLAAGSVVHAPSCSRQHNEERMYLDGCPMDSPTDPTHSPTPIPRGSAEYATTTFAPGPIGYYVYGAPNHHHDDFDYDDREMYIPTDPHLSPILNSRVSDKHAANTAAPGRTDDQHRHVLTLTRHMEFMREDDPVYYEEYLEWLVQTLGVAGQEPEAHAMAQLLQDERESEVKLGMPRTPDYSATSDAEDEDSQGEEDDVDRGDAELE